jgi:hypothetical protein
MISILAGEKIGVRGWWIVYTPPFLHAALAGMVCKHVLGDMKEEEQGTDEEKVAIVSDDDNNDLESAPLEETPKTESPGGAK